MTDTRDEPDSKRRYMDAVLAGDFMSATRLFEHLQYEERLISLPGEMDPVLAGRARLRHRAGILDRVLSCGSEGWKGAWLAEVDGRPIVCAFDEWIVLDPAHLSVARSLAERLGLIDA